MNIKEFANLLDGRQYRSEIWKEEEKIAKDNGFVVVFGASDDLMEFRGAINGEVDCFEGGIAYITPDKELLDSDCLADCNECKYFKKILDSSIKIEALWCKTTTNCCWTYETEIPHEIFMIWEDGEQYCQGIVFDLNKI